MTALRRLRGWLRQSSLPLRVTRAISAGLDGETAYTPNCAEGG